MNTQEPAAIEETQVDDLRAAILKRLTEHDIAEVHIEFDGSCDEGQVEGIVGTKVDGTPESLDWPCDIPGKVKPNVDTPPGRGMAETSAAEGSRSMTMRELLDDWSYELLDDVGLDWVNNDGGYGKIVIFPAGDIVRCEMNIRFVDSDYSEHEL